LDLPVADQVSVTAYGQNNERRLTNDVFVSFGPPGAGVSSQSENYTDLTTLGFRVEATKLALDRVLLTYGVDLFRDDSENTDSSLTAMVGFGPMPPTVSTVPLTPNATYRSAGAFLQGDVQLTSRASVILGGRFQDVRAATKETPGRTDPLVEFSDRTVVGTANLLYRVLDDLTLVGNVGRAFRSPNLIERFFNGLTPEGAAYQIPNPDLKPETSLNVDLGLRYRSDVFFVEAFVFQNEIRDGIRIQENVGDTLNGLPTYSNVNVEKLRFRGVELSADLVLPWGLEVGGSFARLSSKDALNENNPVGDAYSSKLLLHTGYRDPAGRFWAGYYLRHNGDRKDSELSGPLGSSPVGTVLPAFTTHAVRGGVTLFRRGSQRHGIGFAVANLTNELYAEFANASFFRPEPGRSLTVSWTSSF
jgi:iron complex outermembrane receptor protein/hemoglobin/transferrin/lactoferrin receptor protein